LLQVKSELLFVRIVRGTEVVSFIRKIESHGKKRYGSAGKLKDKKITCLADAFKFQKLTHLFSSL
jgi:hypothetical protein